MGQKFVGRADDADTDSHSDEDFDGREDEEKTEDPADIAEKFKMNYNNIELLEKGFVFLFSDRFRREEDICVFFNSVWVVTKEILMI